MKTHDELIGRARELAPQVEKAAAETEKNGRMSSELLDQFCDAGFMEILVPKRFGGHEMNYSTFAGVIKEVAPYCTSTAWVLSFYIGHNYIHALFPEKSQEEVFADKPYALTPGTVAPSFTLTPHKDGFLASGKSSWNSGSAKSDWYIASGMIKREGQPPEFRVFLVPTKDAIYIENWDVAGMRGTSSSDMELRDVFVPEYHTALTGDIMDGRSPGSKVHANPMYSLPLNPFIMGEVLPVIVGAYRGAANTFKTLTEQRFSTYSAAKVAGKQSAQMRIGHGMAGAEVAEDLLSVYINAIDNADPDKMRAPEVRAAFKARVGMILEYCTNGINHLVHGAGAGAFRNDCALQRLFRDINMLRVHGLLDVETATETYGRILMGLPNEAPI